MTPAHSADDSHQDSLSRRYVYKVGANLTAALVGALTLVIAPRALGPNAYGDFSFLTSYFLQVVAVLEVGTSLGFFTKLSQRQQESGLVHFYLCFAAVVSALIVSGAAVAHVTGVYSFLWPGQRMQAVYLACGFALLTWVALVFGRMADAYGLTVPAERLRMAQRFFAGLLLLLLFFAHRLDLFTLFLYNYAILLFLIVAQAATVHRRQPLLRNWAGSRRRFRAYASEFYLYSHPLFTYSLVVLGGGIVTRWWLQLYGGSMQQGFFGLSQQIAAGCFVVSGAMTPLLTREFSVAYGRGDMAAMKGLFRRYVPLFYALMAYLCCYIGTQAERITWLFGGQDFTEAVPVVAIMAFYPIHQTYGQLSGAVFFAAGKTGQYRNIGVASTIVGLPLVYLLIAPRARGGLDTGAQGLAAATLLLQCAAVNVQLFLNSRFLGVRFWRYAVHQALCLASFLAIALAARLIVDRGLGLAGSMLGGLVATGLLYTCLAAGMAFASPSLLGLHRSDLREIASVLKTKLGFAS